MTRVKVCGITGYGDAVTALELGADALGFNFHPASPRYIRPGAAAAIIRRLPPFAVTVGVFVNLPAGDVALAAEASGVGVVQLHGDETPETCRALARWPLLKALRIGGEGVPGDLETYPVAAFLLDARDEALYGGTGKTFDWTLARAVSRVRPVILAGGLRAENVSEAIRVARPYAVDVCSGVETAPGVKDARRIAQFMKEVRDARQSDHRP
ncbi:MAG: phosphoribosylanthranilate isomerase [Acidobacteria bacterium]|nr:phosphoribosylanthranilate isomerase [Acidobacteriota bacterium]